MKDAKSSVSKKVSTKKPVTKTQKAKKTVSKFATKAKPVAKKTSTTKPVTKSKVAVKKVSATKTTTKVSTTKTSKTKATKPVKALKEKKTANRTAKSTVTKKVSPKIQETKKQNPFESDVDKFFKNKNTLKGGIMRESLEPMNYQTDGKKRVIIIVAICLALLLLIGGAIGIASAVSKGGVAERNNTIELAKKYIENGQYDPAMQLLNQLLIKDANDEEASKMLDDVIALKAGADKNDFPSYNISVDTQAMQDSLESMKDQLARANEANVKNQEAMNSLLEQNKAAEDERQAQMKAVEEQQKAEEAKRKAYEEELANKNKALQQRINDINQAIAIGKSELNTGKNDDALKSFKKATDLLPIAEGEPRFSASKYAEIADALYNASEKTKDETEKTALRSNAVSYAEKAIKNDPKEASAHYILGKDADAKKDLTKAASEFELAVKGDPENSLYYYNLGRIQYRQRQFEKAKYSFESATRLNKNYDSAYFNLGMTYGKLNLNKEALAALRTAHTINNQHSKAYLEEARLLANTYKDYNGAISVYNQVVRIDPENGQALSECGTCYAKLEKYKEAEDCFRRAISKLKPGEKDPLVYYNLATALLNQDKLNDAKDNALIAYNSKDSLRNADKASVVYNYALILDKLDDGNAIKLYQEVLSYNPNHNESKINLGVMFMELTPPDVDSALALFLQAYKADSKNFEVNNNLGSAYLIKKDFTNAITYFQQALSISKGDNKVRCNLASAYSGSGDFQNALTVYKEVIQNDANYLDAYIEIAKVCIALQDTSKAEGYLLTVQQKNPSYRKDDVDALLATVRM